jgi:hypothetical protein
MAIFKLYQFVALGKRGSRRSLAFCNTDLHFLLKAACLELHAPKMVKHCDSIDKSDGWKRVAEFTKCTAPTTSVKPGGRSALTNARFSRRRAATSLTNIRPATSQVSIMQFEMADTEIRTVLRCVLCHKPFDKRKLTPGKIFGL